MNFRERAVTPSLISHYRIIRSLGMGGMGEVFLAEDTKLERQVAIKCLAPKAVGNEQAEKRLIREAKAAATLDHPNICAVHEVGSDGERAFIVMQFIEGETLSWRLHNAPPSIEESVELVSQVAEALAEAHSRGVIHRDIKPQNLMVTSRGQIKVLDFGLAKWNPVEATTDTQQDTRSILTEHGMVVGTVPYMSPEQVRGDAVDSRADIFALGTVLYECVTGRSAFSGTNSMDICAQVIHVDPDRPSDLNQDVPFELDRIIAKAMAKDRAARYQSASELLADLRAVQGRLRAGDSHSLSAERITKGARRLSRTLAIEWRNPRVQTVAVIALTALSGAVWFVVRNTTAGPHQPSPEARRMYDVGAAALRDGAYYQASKNFQSAINLDNKYVLAHAHLAEAYAELGYVNKAKDELLIAQSLAPDRAQLPRIEANYLKAITAIVTRDFKSAIGVFETMVNEAAAADKPVLLLDLGRSYEKDENLEQAIATYLKVIKLDEFSAAAMLRLAVLYGRQQNVQAANEYFDKAQSQYQQFGNFEEQCDVRYQRGILLTNVGEFDRAHKELDAAMKMADVTENKYQKIRTILQLSVLAFNEGNTTLAKQKAEEAIDLAQRNDIRNLATNGLIDLGYALMSRGEFGEAGKALNRALESAEIDNSTLGQARAQLGQGNLYLQLDNPDEAITALSQALEFYKSSGYRRQTSTCLLLLSRANRIKGKYDEALATSGDVLTLAKDLNDNSLVAAAHSNIGYVLGIDQERYAEGLAHMEESERLFDMLGDKLGVGFDLMHQGRMLWQLGRYSEARKALDEAFKIADHPDASYKEVLAYICLANAQMLLSEARFSDSVKQSQKALELTGNPEGKQDKEVTIQAKCALGLATALSGSSRAGREICEQAVDAARRAPSPRLLSSSLLSLAEALLAANDPRKALASALEAKESFERYGQQDSLWRAWLIAARASKLAADSSAAEYANRAMDSLLAFERALGPDASEKYSARPDVKASHGLIEQLRATK